jgi:NADP-dependent 3-hydroxy acid dehydrogenase YdfG
VNGDAVARAGHQDLEGRRVLVSGATGSIGRATVAALVAGGARVTALGRDRDRLEELASTPTSQGRVTTVVADVTVPEEIADAVVLGQAAMGGIDAVVCLAGVLHRGPIETGSVADWREMLDVNVIGLLVVAQESLAALRCARYPDLLVVGSMSGRRVHPGEQAVYSASKFAVHALATSLRRELPGVRVSLVSPGSVEGEMQRGAAPRPTIPPEGVAQTIVAALSLPWEWNALESALVPTAQQL